MSSRPYDVVLIPEPGLARKAIKLSEKLKEKGVYFTLNNKTFFPHLSLYMLQLNDVGLKRALKLLSLVASNTKKMKMRAHNYHYESGYVDIEYIKTTELESLQRTIIEKLNPIRDGLRDRDKERLVSAVGETKFNLENYGYRSVGNIFFPHLTFTRFTSNQEDIVKTFPPKESFNGEYQKLGLYQMGDNGTCTKKLEVWNLC